MNTPETLSAEPLLQSNTFEHNLEHFGTYNHNIILCLDYHSMSGTCVCKHCVKTGVLSKVCLSVLWARPNMETASPDADHNLLRQLLITYKPSGPHMYSLTGYNHNSLRLSSTPADVDTAVQSTTHKLSTQHSQK